MNNIRRIAHSTLPCARIVQMSTLPGVIQHYRSLIELPQAAPAVTLLEGDTPLIPLHVLAQEGLWVEPASAAGVAGLLGQKDAGEIDFNGQSIVCICTGHGLKDPEIITKRHQELDQNPANASALEDLIVAQ